MNIYTMFIISKKALILLNKGNKTVKTQLFVITVTVQCVRVTLSSHPHTSPPLPHPTTNTNTTTILQIKKELGR